MRLAYEGRFDFGLSDQKEEYTRGFRETVGIVSKQGVYLAGSGFWYPHVDARPRRVRARRRRSPRAGT